MIKKILFLLWLSCLSWGCSVAQVVGVTDLMVENARRNLQNSIELATGDKARRVDIYDSAFRGASACSSSDCAYEIYINGLYDLVEYLGANRKCPISLKDLSGVWINSSKWGRYEKISLSQYKGRPSVHQFLVFKSSNNVGLEDGFGGWRFSACKVKTIERISSSGRVFMPGNDLVILSYNKKCKMLVLLDGDFVVEYFKSN